MSFRLMLITIFYTPPTTISLCIFSFSRHQNTFHNVYLTYWFQKQTQTTPRLFWQMASNLSGKKYQEHVTISSDYPRLTSWGINFCGESLRMIERQLLFVLEVCNDFIVSALSGKRQSFPWWHSCFRLWFTTYISRQVYFLLHLSKFDRCPSLFLSVEGFYS